MREKSPRERRPFLPGPNNKCEMVKFTEKPDESSAQNMEFATKQGNKYVACSKCMGLNMNKNGVLTCSKILGGDIGAEILPASVLPDNVPRKMSQAPKPLPRKMSVLPDNVQRKMDQAPYLY